MAKCMVCNLLFKDGDRVEVLIHADFKLLKSNIVSAIDKSTMEVVPGTIAHVKCLDDEDNYESDPNEPPPGWEKIIN